MPERDPREVQEAEEERNPAYPEEPEIAAFQVDQLTPRFGRRQNRIRSYAQHPMEACKSRQVEVCEVVDPSEPARRHARTVAKTRKAVSDYRPGDDRGEHSHRKEPHRVPNELPFAPRDDDNDDERREPR